MSAHILDSQFSSCSCDTENTRCKTPDLQSELRGPQFCFHRHCNCRCSCCILMSRRRVKGGSRQSREGSLTHISIHGSSVPARKPYHTYCSGSSRYATDCLQVPAQGLVLHLATVVDGQGAYECLAFLQYLSAPLSRISEDVISMLFPYIAYDDPHNILLLHWRLWISAGALHPGRYVDGFLTANSCTRR